MNEGLKIQFNGRQSEILLEEGVSDFAATVQNATVCIGTEVGTDKAFPTKGVELLREANQGKLINQQVATHASNFAAIDVLFFINETDTEDAVERLQEIKLAPVVIESDKVRVNAQFFSSEGRYIGRVESL